MDGTPLYLYQVFQQGLLKGWCHQMTVSPMARQGRAVGLAVVHQPSRRGGRRRAGRAVPLPLHCVSTAFAAKTLPLSCVSTAFVAKTPPLLPHCLRAFVAKPLPLSCVPTAFVAKTVPLSCVPTAFTAKTVPFALRVHYLRALCFRCIHGYAAAFALRFNCLRGQATASALCFHRLRG